MRAPGRRCLPGRRALGFTLIELIIALALIALITLLLFSGLRLGARAWDGVDALAERHAELRSARTFLDQALRQSRDLTLLLEDQEHQVFVGNGDSLEFAAPLSEYVGVPGLYILRLGLDGRGENRRLVLTRWLLHPDVLLGDDSTPEWMPLDPGSPGISGAPAEDKDLAAGAFGQTVLLDGVEDFELAYFGVAEEIDGLTQVAGTDAGPGQPEVPQDPNGVPGLENEPEGQWYDEWVGQPHPPELVRLRLTSTRQGWPDSLIGLPRVDQAQGGAIQVGAPLQTEVTDPGAPAAPGQPRGPGAGQPGVAPRAAPGSSGTAGSGLRQRGGL
jgi:general secretion pathway protein J